MDTKKKLSFPFLIICLGIILCVMLSSIFFSIKQTIMTNNSATTFNSISYNIYFLTINKSQNENEAILLGKDSMSNGNSGYIWESDGAFYLISSAYKNENDATLVKNKLQKENIASEILKINFPSVKISSDFSFDEREIITKALNSLHLCYENLYDIAISLENGLTNETGATLSISSTLTNFVNTKNQFETIFKNSSLPFISTIKSYLISTHESLSLLLEKTSITPAQTFNSLIKYRYCEILHLNFNMILDLLTSV